MCRQDQRLAVMWIMVGYQGLLVPTSVTCSSRLTLGDDTITFIRLHIFLWAVSTIVFKTQKPFFSTCYSDTGFYGMDWFDAMQCCYYQVNHSALYWLEMCFPATVRGSIPHSSRRHPIPSIRTHKAPRCYMLLWWHFSPLSLSIRLSIGWWWFFFKYQHQCWWCFLWSAVLSVPRASAPQVGGWDPEICDIANLLLGHLQEVRPAGVFLYFLFLYLVCQYFSEYIAIYKSCEYLRKSCEYLKKNI